MYFLIFRLSRPINGGWNLLGFKQDGNDHRLSVPLSENGMSETWNIHVAMHNIRFQWKLGRRWQIRHVFSVSVHSHKPPKNHLPCTTHHHFQHKPSTKTPGSLGILVCIWGGPRSYQCDRRMSVRRKPCRTRLIGGGSPPGPASYENCGSIMPTVDTLHYLRRQGVNDDSRIPPGDSLSINLNIFVYGWLGDKSRRRRSDDRYLAARHTD